MLTLIAAALTFSGAIEKMNDIEQAMTDCSLGVDHYCHLLTTDEFEEDLNDLVIFQQQFQPQSDEEQDEWNEALRNLNNAAADADYRIRESRK